MSLVNISLTPQRALIAVDTETGNPNGEFGEGSKMTLLPHCNIVLAVRGTTVLMGTVFSGAVMAWPSDFETIEKNMPAVMTQTIDYMRANAAQLFPNTEIDQDDHRNVADQNVMMVGYSPSRGRMAAVAFSTSRSSAEVASYELEAIDANAAPWSEDWEEDMFDPNTPELMLSLAKFQRKRCKSILADTPIGGRLMLCELTKDEAKFSSLGLLDPQPCSS